MARSRQYSVSCLPLEWETIRERAAAAGTSVSRFVLGCALDDEAAHRLSLSEEEQRALYNRVNLLLMATQDLLRPLPGSEVTLREAVEFLYRAERRTRTEPPRNEGQSVLPGLLDGSGK